MKEYKKLNTFQVRVMNDKPILQKNANDFDDLDVESSFSIDVNDEIELDFENGIPKTKSTKSILKNSNKKPFLNKLITFKKDDDSENSNNSNNNNKNKKYIRFKLDEEMYSDRSYDSDSKNIEKNKKIEKALMMSITNKESMTRENLHLAETIKFKDEPDKIIFTDEYGFLKDDKNSPTNKMTKKFEKKKSKKMVTSKSAKNLLQINARMEKWNYMLNHYQEFSTKKREILKSRTRKGIPDNLRGYAWQIFAEKKKFYVPNLYKELESQPIKEDLEIVIMKDLDRTFPLIQFFREKYGNGQRQLYKVLSAYSKYNTEVGYVQGMGFIAAIFLTYMDEESSFFMLHSLMKKYEMEGTFFDNFPDLKKKFFILLNLQKKLIPKIYNIFQRDGVLPTMYASTWFISLFSKTLDFKIVVRIFDCFFLEGFKVIYRISLALLKLRENDFIKAEKGNSMTLLVSCHENVDEEELFKIAFGFSISRNFIEKCEAEFEKVKNNEKNEFISQLCW